MRALADAGWRPAGGRACSPARDAARAPRGSSRRAVAYPFGASDARIERLAAAAGYELGFGGVRGGGNGSTLNLARVPVYVWNRGNRPLGLRHDGLGAAGRFVAHVANRCAVGTSWMLKLRGRPSAISRQPNLYRTG